MLGDTNGDWRPFRKFTLPGTELVVEKTSHGEHHMSSQTIEFLLPFELGGHTSWFTTNGTLSADEDGRFLYLWDATAVIRVDLTTREPHFFVPPKGAYISTMEV